MADDRKNSPTPPPPPPPRPETFKQQIRILREIGASERTITVVEKAAASTRRK